MKPHLIVFAILIAIFIAYNFFFRIEDDRMNTIVNIILASILFGYIAFMAYSLLKKMKK
ncbi:FeoB-associated Cys-rich membrane protein [Chryseobacterium sp. MIQD13]|uniref:FeoB-associated Cys-rich membrane protein n=1 Tax=Chryseobacterium sp. BLS98 TaxID=885586 RepID=UPI0013F45B73|nr:FeoB-associated Cys-rich membrane protein [Chryseobacterium sp. BLS98]